MSAREVNRRAFLAGSATVAAGVGAGVGVPLLGTATAAQAAPAFAPGRAPEVKIPDVAVRPQVLADPTEATLAEAVTLIRRGKLTSLDLVHALLDRIGTYEPVYLAFNAIDADGATAAARAQDRRRTGPLGGIPLCIKDNYYTAGLPTTANSFVFQDFVPPYDATSVARLKAAGGIVLGKGQMGPLATTRATTPNGTVTTVNAWTPTDITVDPGGSSTGPGCAVAGRLATSAIGTQTGGSIVNPSNAQNLTGLKPTMGRTSIYGVIPLSYTRDHSGPLARTALDAAIMLAVMAGPDPNDVRTQGLPAPADYITSALPVRRGKQVVMRRRVRIGVPPDYLAASAGAGVLALRRAFLATMAAIPGATVVDVTYPDDWDLMTGVFNNVRLSERTEEMLPFLQRDPKLLGVSSLSWLQGLFLSGDEWVTGQRAKTRLLREVLDGVFGQCDVVLQTGPTQFDQIGLPELALPIGFQAVGANPKVPVGTILGGQPYEEDLLLEVAAAYQAVTDWHDQRPADPPAPAAARTTLAAPQSRAAAASRATPEERGAVHRLSATEALSRTA
ncbi:amidase [Actinacidiphila acididurans]|uniref:Amidase n=1 Tax=Actinacidiphila acididurans TaxID=2784346 RepID=A0ABS2U011_9ACTN|nr:amidase [Actinacidiphila acididurans]MBM9508662.1 amidase [Actinacidiphila acididurans]